MAAERRGQVGVAGVFHQGGQARVAIVKANHVETSPGQLLAERFLPARHLRAEARYEKKRWRRRITKRFVLDLDSVRLDPRHEIILAPYA